jgi:mannose/fructose/N-acetylgalactosamine-specific phosphotransferase system component IIC
MELIPLALLGAILGLDVVSFPQAMISRPIVAATAGGALVGEPASGLLVGALLELIAQDTLPFGASRYPEWGSASVVGGALVSAYPANPAGALALAVLGALATAWIGGWSMIELRKLNARWAGARRDAIEAGSRNAVVSLHLTGMSADFVRGGVLTVIAYIALHPIMQASVATWGADPTLSRAVVVGVSLSIALSACWKLFHGVSMAWWHFGAGIALGIIVSLRMLSR